MPRFKPIVLSLAALLTGACTAGKAAEGNLIDAAQLKSLIDAGKVQVVDVREPGEFSAGHIPGAINAPLSRFDCNALNAPAGKEIILQCRSAKRSAMALEQCQSAGRADIKRHLAGGFLAWEKAGYPVTR